MQKRSDHDQRQHQHDQQHQKRRNHKVKGRRYGFAELFLQFAADHACDEGRKDAALIADNRNKAEQIQRRHAA